MISTKAKLRLLVHSSCGKRQNKIQLKVHFEVAVSLSGSRGGGGEVWSRGMHTYYPGSFYFQIVGVTGSHPSQIGEHMLLPNFHCQFWVVRLKTTPWPPFRTKGTICWPAYGQWCGVVNGLGCVSQASQFCGFPLPQAVFIVSLL